MATLLDTTALIDILEDNLGASALVEKLEEETVFTSRINVFEVLVGVYALPSKKRIEQAEKLFAHINILELNSAAAKKAAQIQGALYQKGAPINDTDCLTAAIALVNGITSVITRNKKHFEKIQELSVESY